MVLSVLFLFIFALMLGRILYMKSRRRELRDLREDVDSTEERLRGKQFEYHSLGAEAETTESEMSALKERIVTLRREIDERAARFAEPYV
jgi:predicted  nucleic acid-binding Zn-ribbon protein